MFSYRRADNQPIKIDSGSMTVLTTAMLLHDWSHIALTRTGEFHKAKFFGFKLPWSEAEALKETLAGKPHILARSREGDLLLVIPAKEHFDDKASYDAAVAKRLEYPSLKQATPLTGMQQKVKGLFNFRMSHLY